MNRHEQSAKFWSLVDLAREQNLRGRSEAPERGWRLVDILGAPLRAYTQDPRTIGPAIGFRFI
jgi:hypothetical protein